MSLGWSASGDGGLRYLLGSWPFAFTASRRTLYTSVGVTRPNCIVMPLMSIPASWSIICDWNALFVFSTLAVNSNWKRPLILLGSSSTR